MNQPNSVALPVSKKWGCCPNNPPGKIQLNRVREALRDVENEHYTSVEKRGIFGKTEGYDAESSYTSVKYCIGGSVENAKRDDVTAVQLKIGEQFGWTVSKDNAAEIVKAIAVETPALEAARPVNDERQTPEQADTAKAERAAQTQASQAADEARVKALRDTMEAAFGIPDRTVSLSPGEKAIVAVLCYDNSHYQSDYYDTHARLGVPLLIGTTRSNREDEASARAAVARFPQLAALKFEWKTEKYSMGHGNYLTSEGVDVPEALGQTRTRYGAGNDPIAKGHWEIQYHNNRRADESFSVFAGFYDKLDPQASAEADAAADARAAGGALGTVKHNLEHNGVEIAFTDKPDDALRYTLKRAGFRITRRPPWKWYQKFSAQAWAKACEIAGVASGVDSQERWGNSAIAGVGVNSPAMMEARAKQSDTGSYVAAQEEAYQDAQAAAIGA